MLVLLLFLACAPEPEVVCDCGPTLQLRVSCEGEDPARFAEEMEEVQTALCDAAEPGCACTCEVR